MGQFLSCISDKELPSCRFIFVCCRSTVDHVDGPEAEDEQHDDGSGTE